MKAWKFGYKKAKEEAKRLYTRIGRVESPALGGRTVSFTAEGFNHLIRKGRIPRTKSEQKRRFCLVPHIAEIVINPEAIVIFRETVVERKANRFGDQVLIVSRARFWTFVQMVDGCRVKVVVRQIDDGSPHFFSVMGDAVEIVKRRKRNKKSPRR